jgi:ABC-type polar amino acid transport system ATPase subunit
MKGDVILKNDYYTYTTFKECNAQLEHNVKLKDDITSQIVIMRHRKTEEYRNKNTDKAPTDNSFREFLNNINF